MANNAFVHLYTIVFVVLQAISFQHRSANATPAFLVTRDDSTPAAVPDRNLTVGPCTWIIDHKCPDDDNVQVYLFTRRNPNDRQRVHIDETWEKSNLSTSFFNPADPVKIIIHGYNADMFLSSLLDMKDEYLQRGNYNLFYIDWSKLAPGPCYLSAVHNARHTGVCIAELVKRILESGMDDIHLIGFSLGAHVTNFVAQSVRPFDIPRISGLDPAMPLYITASADNKLDPSDAKFVDVIHTNALIQGKIERCGHVDFYMNGGVIQPGCSKGGSNPFACSHHRAPDYYSESIRSFRGFWGWPCTSYINYLLGLCPKTDRVVVAGEDCVSTTRGMFLVTTNSEAPFASGRWTDLPAAPNNGRIDEDADLRRPSAHRIGSDPTMQSLDEWGKLEGAFNNRQRPGAMIGFDEMADFQWDQILANDVDGTTAKPPTSTTIRYPLRKKSQFLTAFSNADETNVVNGEPISKENFLVLYHQLFGKSAT